MGKQNPAESSLIAIVIVFENKKNTLAYFVEFTVYLLMLS